MSEVERVLAAALGSSPRPPLPPPPRPSAIENVLASSPPPPSPSAVENAVASSTPPPWAAPFKPKIVKIARRLYIRRGELERYKVTLFVEAAGGPPPEDAPEFHNTDLVSVMVMARELGITRRTLDRHLLAILGPRARPEFTSQTAA